MISLKQFAAKDASKTVSNKNSFEEASTCPGREPRHMCTAGVTCVFLLFIFVGVTPKYASARCHHTSAKNASKLEYTLSLQFNFVHWVTAFICLNGLFCV